MEIDVTFLNRRGRDAVLRRSQRVAITTNQLHFGRGTDADVELPDLRVNLAAGDLEIHEDHLYFRARPETDIRINDAPTSGGVVQVGDRIGIGPYEVKIEAPPEGAAVAVTVEMVKPSGDTLQRVVSQTRLGLDKTALNKRRLSWAFFSVLAILCLILPIFASFSGQKMVSRRDAPPPVAMTFVNLSWNVGQVSNPHRFFSGECNVCHQSKFASVPDMACLNCHANVGNHLGMDAALLGTPGQKVEQARCGSCHEEHRGSMVIGESGFCLSCHRSLETTAPKAGVKDVHGFPSGHPQFRATVVEDAELGTVRRMEIGATPKPADRPNMKFSHAAHLIETGFLTREGRKIMVCADCHVPEPSGQGFMPMTYAKQCQSCHDLKFDADLPWKEVPHGNDATVKSAVEDFYGHQALISAIPPPSAPEALRRRVGEAIAAPTEAQRRDALSWVTQRTADALTLIYNEKRGCAYCHVLVGQGIPSVLPVYMRTRFLPQAKFDHARHTAVPCAECHDARHSETSADVLVPGVENCTSCHGAEKARFKTQSSCTSCHVFHRNDKGLMRPPVQKAGP